MPATTQFVRQLLLALMLISLALTALAGGLGTIWPDSKFNDTQRIMVTGIASAVACLAMLPAALIFEKRNLRASSIICIGVIFSEYLLFVGMFWIETSFLNSSMQIWLLMYAVGFAGGPCTGIVRMLHYPTRRIAGIAGLSLNAIALIFMIVGGVLELMNVWFTGFWLSIFSLVIVANLIGLTSLRPSWRWIGLLATASGYGLIVWSIFTLWDRSDTWNYPRMLFWLSALGVFCGHLNVSLRAPLSPRWTWLRWGTVAMIAAAGILVSYRVTLPSTSLLYRHAKGDRSNEDLLRARIEWLNSLISATAIAGGCGSAAMFLLKRMNRKTKHPMAGPADVASVTVECPTCHTSQPLPLGGSACVACGLRFSIRIDEPRCERCNYLLYRITSDCCPECGNRIPRQSDMRNDQRCRSIIPKPMQDLVPTG